jgi:molybdopterin-guanine dinucleotide biosynthesis protein A
MGGMSGKGQPIGLVLAGGRGRRMGRSKGDLRFGDRSLAERAAATLQPFCRSVLISVAVNADNPVPDRIAIEDEAPAGRGPLAGIDRAFGATDTADLLVLACDYPGVSGALLLRLLDAAESEDEIVMPTDAEGRDHPLVALWSRRIADPVGRALRAERFAVRDLVEAARVRRLGRDDLAGFDLETLLVNVNTPEDLDRL